MDDERQSEDARGGLVRSGHLLDWSLVDRCRLLIVLTIPFYLTYAVRSQYLLTHPEVEPYWDRSDLVWARDGLLVACAFWALFLAWGSFERRRTGRRTAYVGIGCLSWWLSISGLAHGLGPITSPAWTVTLIGGVWHLLLFPRPIALLGIGAGVLLMGLSLALVAAGLVPYAPLLVEQPIVGSEVELSYLVGNTVGTVIAIVLILGVVIYMVEQWRGALAGLERGKADLERTVEERTSELMLAGRQLQEGQKLEAVGRLAGGIAHDFNNLLAIILGYAHDLLGPQATGGQVRQDIVEIKTAATRATSLVEQLLAVGRRQVLQPQPLQLNELVVETAELLQPLMAEDVKLRLQLEPGLGIVKADAGQMQQVLLNLATNARDAMSSGGRLTIETANLDLERPRQVGSATIPAGSYVTLSVSDSGCGMDPQLQAQAFEPFFTTKEKGRGTGLGLASVYGIIVQSSGLLSLESRVGEGSRFCVYLARVSSSIADASVQPTPAPVATQFGTLLLAEDDGALRRVLCRKLEARGHTVLAAADGLEALEVAQHYPGAIDLLVSDVVMPRMNGAVLVREFLLVRPDSGVLFMTAHAEEILDLKGVSLREDRVLRKPFVEDALEDAVSAALRERAR